MKVQCLNGLSSHNQAWISLAACNVNWYLNIVGWTLTSSQTWANNFYSSNLLAGSYIIIWPQSMPYQVFHIRIGCLFDRKSKWEINGRKNTPWKFWKKIIFSRRTKLFWRIFFHSFLYNITSYTTSSTKQKVHWPDDRCVEPLLLRRISTSPNVLSLSVCNKADYSPYTTLGCWKKS